jgi:hypothetical protein
MASIKERKGKNGSTYHVQIRQKNLEICKSFRKLEDAQLFIFFKENLATNMHSFQVDVKDRVRLEDIIELKKKEHEDIRTIQELDNTLLRIKENMRTHFFLCELTLEDWLECLKRISTLKIPERSKAKKMNLISPLTVRRVFATISSAFSHAISLGIALENFPLQVIQRHINPSLKNNVVKE